jgi:cytochrome c-type biogenesis protein CcmH
MRIRRMWSLLAIVAMVSLSTVVHAVEPDEVLKDPAQEARAREITRELKCVVCQNQSVDDSDAPLAKDIRVLVRERIIAGETDDAVREYIVQRYGQRVLLRPPLGIDTALIWIGPFVLFAIALGTALLFLRRGRGDALQSQPLTPEEQSRLDARLQEDRT